jgi:hypothetical protein
LQIAYCLERACHKRVTWQVFVAVVGTLTARVVTVTIRSVECRKRDLSNQHLPLTRLVWIVPCSRILFATLHIS